MALKPRFRNEEDPGVKAARVKSEALELERSAMAYEIRVRADAAAPRGDAAGPRGDVKAMDASAKAAADARTHANKAKKDAGVTAAELKSAKVDYLKRLITQYENEHASHSEALTKYAAGADGGTTDGVGFTKNSRKDALSQLERLHAVACEDYDALVAPDDKPTK